MIDEFCKKLREQEYKPEDAFEEPEKSGDGSPIENATAEANFGRLDPDVSYYLASLEWDEDANSFKRQVTQASLRHVYVAVVGLEDWKEETFINLSRTDNKFIWNLLELTHSEEWGWDVIIEQLREYGVSDGIGNSTSGTIFWALSEDRGKAIKGAEDVLRSLLEEGDWED